MKKRMKLRFSAPLFVTLAAAYFELLLHFWTMEQFSAGRLVAVTTFGLGLGALLGLIVSLLPKPGAQKCFACILTTLLAVLYLMEYFLNDAYQNFMTFETIFAGADGVAQDYLSLVMSLLLHELWRILLFLLPTVFYAVFTRATPSNWKKRTILAAGSLTLYMLGFIAVQEWTVDAHRFTSAYDFDSAVHSFGLLSLIHI